MAKIVRADLITRLEQHEDSFVERKPNASDLEPTLVAFANSVPEGREAIIYLGVRDNGEVIGVEGTDSVQKRSRKCATKSAILVSTSQRRSLLGRVKLFLQL